MGLPTLEGKENGPSSSSCAKNPVAKGHCLAHHKPVRASEPVSSAKPCWVCTRTPASFACRCSWVVIAARAAPENGAVSADAVVPCRKRLSASIAPEAPPFSPPSSPLFKVSIESLLVKILLFIAQFRNDSAQDGSCRGCGAHRTQGPGTAGGSGVVSGREMNNNLTRNEQFSIN